MKRLNVALLVFAAAMLPASSAFADTFDFSFSGAVFSGSGTFTATPDGVGKFLITNVTGEVAGSTITGLLPIGTYPTGAGEAPNDNILIYPPQLFGTKFFDHDGVSFSLADGIDVNLNDTLGFENAVAGAHNFTEFVSVDVDKETDQAVAPEPGSLVLLGTGILGVAGTLRRRLTA
jgi:hypothetical protein